MTESGKALLIDDMLVGRVFCIDKKLESKTGKEKFYIAVLTTNYS